MPKPTQSSPWQFWAQYLSELADVSMHELIAKAQEGETRALIYKPTEKFYFQFVKLDDIIEEIVERKLSQS